MNRRSIVLQLIATIAMADDAQPILPDRPFPAVIFPAEVARTQRPVSSWFSQFWTPTVEDVTKAEKRIAEFLATAPDDPSISAYQRKLRIPLRDQPTSYFRQYLGIVRDGRRVVLCVSNRIGRSGAPPPKWRQQLEFWFDAAGWTWHIDYDVTADACNRFHVDEGY